MLAQEIYVLGGDYKKDGKWIPVSTCESLSLQHNQWSSQPSMLLPMTVPIAAAIEDSILVLFPDTSTNKPYQQGSRITLQELSLATRRWAYRKPLPESVGSTSGAQAAVLGGDMYVVGGVGRICARYSPRTDVWSSLTQPQYHHSGGAVVCYNDRIVVLGGSCLDKDGKEHKSDVVEEYNVKEDRWELSSYRMPVGLWHHSIVVMDASSS